MFSFSHKRCRDERIISVEDKLFDMIIDYCENKCKNN